MSKFTSREAGLFGVLIVLAVAGLAGCGDLEDAQATAERASALEAEYAAERRAYNERIADALEAQAMLAPSTDPDQR